MPAVRRRQETGNFLAPFHPRQIPGCLGYYTPWVLYNQDPLNARDIFVWPDESGNGGDLIAGAGVSGYGGTTAHYDPDRGVTPCVQVHGMFGLPFDPFAGRTDASIFAVVRDHNPIGFTPRIISSNNIFLGANSVDHSLSPDGLYIGQVGNHSAGVARASAGLGGFHFMGLDTTVRAFCDYDVGQSSGREVAIPTVAGGLTLGSRPDSGDGWFGEIAFMAFYDHIVPDAQRVALHSYWKNHAGAWYLP